MQRPQAAQGQKLSNGAPVRPRQFAHQTNCSCSSCVARDDRAADHIAVAVEILGRRVHDEVGAERQRLLPQPARGRCCPRPPARRRRDPALANCSISVMRSSGLLGVSIHSRAVGLDKRGAHRGLVAEVHELAPAVRRAAARRRTADRCRHSSHAARRCAHPPGCR